MAKLEMLLPELESLVFLYLDLGEDPTLFTPHAELQWRRIYIWPCVFPNHISINGKSMLHSLDNKPTETISDDIITYHRFGKIYRTIHDQTKLLSGQTIETIRDHEETIVYQKVIYNDSTFDEWYFKNGSICSLSIQNEKRYFNLTESN